MNLLDEIVRHNIKFSDYAELLGNECMNAMAAVCDEIEELLADFNLITTQSKKKQAEKVIAEKIAELVDILDSIIIQFVNSCIARENEWFKSFGEKYLGIRFDLPERLSNLIKEYPLVTVGTAMMFASTLSERASKMFNDYVATSYVMGIGLDEIIDDSRIESLRKIAFNDAEMLGNSLPNVYDRMVYTKNDNKIQKFQWIAILDSHTCASCGELNGKVFDGIKEVPLYPLHRSCRCSLIPIPDGTKIKEVPTYTEWLETQDEETKKEVLGKTRYSLYKQGMKISQFYANGRKINLSKLNK